MTPTNQILGALFDQQYILALARAGKNTGGVGGGLIQQTIEGIEASHQQVSRPHRRELTAAEIRQKVREKHHI